MLKSDILTKLFKIAGFILLGGLVVEVVTLFWFNPMSFLFHMGLAGVLVTAGAVLYLYVVVRT